jgi:hypothetical protein
MLFERQLPWNVGRALERVRVQARADDLIIDQSKKHSAVCGSHRPQDGPRVFWICGEAHSLLKDAGDQCSFAVAGMRPLEGQYGQVGQSKLVTLAALQEMHDFRRDEGLGDSGIGNFLYSAHEIPGDVEGLSRSAFFRSARV